jgi:hypothetical protein
VLMMFAVAGLGGLVLHVLEREPERMRREAYFLALNSTKLDRQTVQQLVGFGLQDPEQAYDDFSMYPSAAFSAGRARPIAGASAAFDRAGGRAGCGSPARAVRRLAMATSYRRRTAPSSFLYDTCPLHATCALYATRALYARSSTPRSRSVASQR